MGCYTSSSTFVTVDLLFQQLLFVQNSFSVFSVVLLSSLRFVTSFVMKSYKIKIDIGQG